MSRPVQTTKSACRYYLIPRKTLVQVDWAYTERINCHLANASSSVNCFSFIIYGAWRLETFSNYLFSENRLTFFFFFFFSFPILNFSCRCDRLIGMHTLTDKKSNISKARLLESSREVFSRVWKTRFQTWRVPGNAGRQFITSYVSLFSFESQYQPNKI